MHMQKVDLKFELQISIIQEGDSFIAYSPAIDLSTVGDTSEQARQRFTEAAQIFFEEISAAGTINDALTDLGWKKQNNQLTPPAVISSTTQQFSIPSFV